MTKFKLNSQLSLLTVASALVFAGCAEKRVTKPNLAGVEKTLQQAEKDARSGDEAKALKEIDAAEKTLIEEDKKHPYAQQPKTWTGEDVKAKADADAILELEKAKRDAKAKLAGDAADEVKRALGDVKTEERR